MRLRSGFQLDDSGEGAVFAYFDDPSRIQTWAICPKCNQPRNYRNPCACDFATLYDRDGSDVTISEQEAHDLGYPGIPDHEIETAAQDALTGTCGECGDVYGGHSDNCERVN